MGEAWEGGFVSNKVRNSYVLDAVVPSTPQHVMLVSFSSGIDYTNFNKYAHRPFSRRLVGL